MNVNETDDELRNRLTLLLPEGAWYSAEDLGNASSEQLDALAAFYKTKRRCASDAGRNP
jgi:hypothetical protein